MIPAPIFSCCPFGERGRHGPKAIRGQGGSELFDPVCCPTRPHRVSPPSFGGCVAWMQGMYDNTIIAVTPCVLRGPEFAHRRSKHLETLVCKAASCAG